MSRDGPSSDQPTQQLPSRARANWDQPTQQLPSQNRASSDQPTQQLPSIFQKDPQTRRRFLKAAIASGTAVAAVGAAGAAAASASPQLLRQIRGEPAVTSGNNPASACVENSSFQPITEFKVDKHGQTQPGTFFVWFTAQHLPAGTYNYTLTPPFGDIAVAGDSALAFQCNDNGNNVFIFPVPNGSATKTCPGADPNPHPPANQVGHTIKDVFPFTTNSLGDFRVRVHLKYNKGPIKSPVTYTFVGTLTNTNTLATYTAQIAVTAKPA